MPSGWSKSKRIDKVSYPKDGVLLADIKYFLWIRHIWSSTLSAVIRPRALAGCIRWSGKAIARIPPTHANAGTDSGKKKLRLPGH